MSACIALVAPTSHARFAITALSSSVKNSYRPRDPDSFSDSSGSTFLFADCMLEQGIVLESGPSGLGNTVFEELSERAGQHLYVRAKYYYSLRMCAAKRGQPPSAAR